MANAKVTLNGITLIDLTGDTVTASDILQGKVAHGSDGSTITGTYVPTTTSLTTGSTNPTESSQHITPPSGYDGFEYFDVGAVSSNYIGSNIPTRTSTNLTVSGSKIIVPSGYYAAEASKAVSAGSATTPATSITANPGLSINSSTGIITGSISKTQNVTPTVSAGYVSTGVAGTISISGSSTLNLSTQAGTTINPTESEQTAVSAGKYTTGAVKVGAIPSTYIGTGIVHRDSDDLSVNQYTVTALSGYYAEDATYTLPSGDLSNISLSINSKGLIYGQASASGYFPNVVVNLDMLQLSTIGATTYTPTTTNQTIASSKYLTGVQTIAGDSNLIAANIASGVTIFGITGTHVGGPSRIAIQETLKYFYGASTTQQNLNTFGSVSGRTLTL